ncbi:MAG: hypothetical protein DMF73_15435 [Acidobacteria bacterium]|nr:MAG: hypothetical protein DMF73_15435 [Acidobacteriota bacterium]
MRAAIAAGEVHAVVGTHALIQEGVTFKQLGLVVIDEQHRFGVMQRAELRARGMNPDVLVMTATPIPRSLAMTVYGDLDVSVIDEMPPGRTPIVTKVFADNAIDRKEVKQLLAREMRAGRQVYVVYPLVEESEKMDLRDATRRYEYLRDKVFPKFSVGLLHGRMKPEEKDEVMRRFVKGEIQILLPSWLSSMPSASVFHSFISCGVAWVAAPNRATACCLLRISKLKLPANGWGSWKRRTTDLRLRKKI